VTAYIIGTLLVYVCRTEKKKKREREKYDCGKKEKKK
jgi:hypothetical protein